MLRPFAYQPPHRVRAAVLGVVALSLTTCAADTGPPVTGAAATAAAAAGAVTSGVASADAAASSPADASVAAPVPAGTPASIPSLERPADVRVVPEAGPADVTDVQPPAPETPPAPDLPAQVPLVEPTVVLRAPAGTALADDALDVVGAAEAVGTAVTSLDVQATGPTGEEDELHALRVDVEAFRPFTPDVTAHSVGVWERLLDGDVVVRHDVAQRLELELGGTVTLRTPHGTVPARVGALAANGAPPLADLLVSPELGELLGADAADTLIVGGGDEDVQALADRLADQLGAEAELVRPPAPRQAPVKRSGSVTLEPFAYTSRGDGTIAIDPDWVARNIVPVEIPGMGTTRCHRVMVPQLQAALREVAEAGLYGHFDPGQFAGCFVPRHILWNPQRGLSMHAWGLAIDFNARDNAYGATPQMDLRIVEIFEKWGFAWGGWWSTPDGMHFELERIIEVG
ncbi:M15 family metallopeptidase [Egicoccus sp. AB-alg2]|uniref:M15 family metallopeptidase n=1 Tax=Egicoccus sp. AB-alg2 TaxID=3242693 RepID=UPI00359D622D